ncbi:porin [Ferrimonas senticii]|uniref:porin n=1 Tax=Ferrimonas senticii TaxID=394566 RepID=UPI000420C8B8|nr:porin [Ferrimonas senticii]
MNRSVIALALATISCSATAQLSEPDFYGRIWLGATHSQNGLASKEKVAGSALENYASRVGVKGNYQVNNDLTLIYQIELGIDSVDEDAKKDPVNARDTFLGLKGQYGTLFAGRMNTALKTSEGPVDAFNATNGDMSYMIAGQDRLSDHLQFIGLLPHRFSVHSSYILEEDFKGNAKLEDAGNFAISLHYGDNKFRTSPLFVSATVADGINGVDASRLTLAYKLDNLKLGAMWQDSDSLKNSNLGGQSYLVSAQYQADANTFKAQFIADKAGMGKVTSTAVAANSHKLAEISDAESYNVSVGIDHQLSKQLSIGALASFYDGEYQQGGQTISYDDTVATAHIRFVF